jgi:hypothetical protein
LPSCAKDNLSAETSRLTHQDTQTYARAGLAYYINSTHYTFFCRYLCSIQTTFAFYAIPPYITKRIKLTKLKVIFCFCSHGTPDSTRSYQAHVQTSHQLNGRWRRLCQLVRARVQGRLFLPRPLIPSANVTPTLFYNIYLYSIIRVMARDTICDWRWMTGWRGKNDARFSFHDRPTPVLSSFFLSFHLFLSHPFPIHHRDWPY